MTKILLTSFQPWLSHHISNSSDDLLEILQNQEFDRLSLHFLRHLPVDIRQAGQSVIKAIQSLQPDGVICCGMAEKRTNLTIESNARQENDQLQTQVNLASLLSHLSHTHLSHDAGKFVCEGLYYHILNYLRPFRPQPPCLFVHVPLLKADNTALIVQDFRQIIEKISQS